MSRPFTGVIACEVLEKLIWFRGLRDFAKLRREVEAGRFRLIPNSEGGADRIVKVSALRISNGEDCILCQVGIQQDGRLVPRCQLPGRKLRQCAGPEDGPRCVLQQDFTPCVTT